MSITSLPVTVTVIGSHVICYVIVTYYNLPITRCCEHFLITRPVHKILFKDTITLVLNTVTIACLHGVMPNVCCFCFSVEEEAHAQVRIPFKPEHLICQLLENACLNNGA